ncbi:integral membrane sensor signal transduction histidine kinase [Marinithermus hydrothermalis DSM 14884]|uniref:Integral membrane sensor signal transduction histidine kinase n=1 Tax=Marinithermus hydrothermalis (strain DSM 14884 / JCM 11576 / T1) TaxID=869210 RepID=F2NK59_MARHT|nr:integral membrane sensor signal transduction histidine kinase [Marinithermus hydrothermalis DSM 14884]
MTRLEVRFLLAAAAAAVLPLIGIWALGWQLLSTAYLGQASGRIEGLAERITAELEARFTTLNRVLDTACHLADPNPTWSLEVALARLPELDAATLTQNGRSWSVSRFVVLTPGASVPPAPPGSVRTDPWGEPVLRIEQHCLRGTLKADVRLRPIFDLVARVPPGYRARLISPQEGLLASSDLTEVLNPNISHQDKSLWRSTRRLTNGWVLAVEAPEHNLVAPLRRANNSFVCYLIWTPKM